MVGPINLKPSQGLKHLENHMADIFTYRPNQPQTLTGIETNPEKPPPKWGVGPINLKPSQGLKR